MVNRNLIRGLDIANEDLDAELEAAMADSAASDFEWGGGGEMAVNQIIEGRILRVDDEFVLRRRRLQERRQHSRATNGKTAKNRPRPARPSRC